MGAITATSTLSPQLRRGRGGVGMGISSFSMRTSDREPLCFSPASPPFSRPLLFHRRPRCQESPKTLGASGSSCSANWSTRSPVSLKKEKSDPSESDSDRLSCSRSSTFSSKLLLLCGCLEEGARVCRGMFAGFLVLAPVPMLKGMLGERRRADGVVQPSS